MICIVFMIVLRLFAMEKADCAGAAEGIMLTRF
jgi:hypothetical protein